MANSLPGLETLHRAGVASDGWERFKAVLDDYLYSVFGAAVTAPTTPPAPGQTLTIDGNGNAVWTYPSSSTALWDVPPADDSADSFNDEFDDGEADPVARGWTVLNPNTPASVYVYEGPVDYNQTPFSLGNHRYRSSIVDGKLRIQFGGNVGNALIKVDAGTSGPATYVARMQQSGMSTSPGSASFCGIFMPNDPNANYNAAGNAAIINEVYDATSRFITYQNGTLTTHLSMVDAAQARSGSIFVVDWKNSGTQATMLQVNDSGNFRMSLFQQSLSGGPFAPTAAGIYCRNAVNNQTVGPQYLEIDYIRRYPTGYYPGQ